MIYCKEEEVTVRDNHTKDSQIITLDLADLKTCTYPLEKATTAELLISGAPGQ